MMHEIKMFDRRGLLSLDGVPGFGADWLARYKPFIEDGKTIMVSPQKIYGPENNDLVPQPCERYISKIIPAGMSANLCVEAHMRELIEQGFEVTVVRDATAGPWHPELGDGYTSALVNFGFIADAVRSTNEVVKAMG
jgi:nicotinamidase-related amidase